MGEWAEGESPTCEIESCDREVAIYLDVPWREDMEVCAAHGRVWAQKEGVVAMPIGEARDEFPDGAAGG